MKRVKGFTIAEVMVASTMFLLLMVVALGTMLVIKRTSEQLKGRSVPRQQLRALSTHLQSAVRAATFVYDTNENVTFSPEWSHDYNHGPTSDPSVPPANDLLMAIPESSDLAPTYKIFGLFLQADASSGRSYEAAHSVVSCQIGGMLGPTPGSPADIALGSLPSTDLRVKNFHTASPGDGLRVRLSESEDGLSFEFVTGHKTEGESLVFETYTTHLTMRNNR